MLPSWTQVVSRCSPRHELEWRSSVRSHIRKLPSSARAGFPPITALPSKNRAVHPLHLEQPEWEKWVRSGGRRGPPNAPRADGPRGPGANARDGVPLSVPQRGARGRAGGWGMDLDAGGGKLGRGTYWCHGDFATAITCMRASLVSAGVRIVSRERLQPRPPTKNPDWKRITFRLAHLLLPRLAGSLPKGHFTSRSLQ